MRREALALGLAVAALAAAAGPAAAKPRHHEEPTTVAIVAGPGLDEPIRLEGRAARRMLYLTTFRGAGLAEPEPPPAGALGPRYVATYLLEREGRGPVLLAVQDLYPYAPGRAWARTSPERPRAAARLGFGVQGGWWHSAALPERLVGAGLPGHAPAVPASRQDAAPPRDGAVHLSPWLLSGAALALLVAAGAVSRRRSTVRA